MSIYSENQSLHQVKTIRELTPTAQMQRQFISVCLGSYLLNPKKAPDAVLAWIRNRATIPDLIGIDVSFEELCSWRWDRAAFPVLDEYENGKNDTIYYALVASSPKGSHPLYPSWILDVLNADAIDSVTIAAELVGQKHSNSQFFFWPFINPKKPTHDRSLGLPIYLSLLSLANEKPIPKIIATGEINRHGELLPVHGVLNKCDKTFEKKFKLFIYPEDGSRLEQRREFKPLGITTLEDAQKAWNGCDIKSTLNKLHSSSHLYLDDLSSSLQAAINSIRQFLSSPERVFIISGMIGSGIEELYEAIVSEVANIGRNCHVLAPNRRMAERYHIKADSIYSHIYSNNAKVKKQQIVYDSKMNIDASNQIYIVGDGHLISDSLFDSNVKYGSGQLLTDFIKFVGIGASQRQVIFIGDPFQMTRGKFEECALSSARIQALTGYEPAYSRLDSLKPEGNTNSFMANCSILANSINIGMYNQLALNVDGVNCEIASTEKSEWEALVRNLFANYPKSTKVIASKHEKVNSANSWIRKNIFNRKTNDIAVGDIIHLHNSFYVSHSDFSEELIPNDSFAEVLSIDHSVEPIKQALSGRADIIEIQFLKIKALFNGSVEEFICLKDFIYSEKPELETDIQMALHVNAEKRFKQVGGKTKELEDSLIFDATSDSEEKSSFANFLRKDPYYNAAKIRFGYALTLNRAQGQHFDTVIADLNTGIGQHNETYYRWVYTLFTVVSSRLIMSNVPHITPLSNIHGLDDSKAQLVASIRPSDFVAYEPESNEDSSIPIPYKITQQPLRNLYRYIFSTLNIQNYGITSYQQTDKINYHEIYGIGGHDRASCKLKLHYDKRFRVTYIDTITSSPAEFAIEVRKQLTSNLRFDSEIQRIFYNTLVDKFQPKFIEISAIEHHDNQEVYYTQSKAGNTKLQIWYHNDGFISKLNLLEYTSNDAVSELKSIALPY